MSEHCTSWLFATARAAMRASACGAGADDADAHELRRALGVARHLLGERAAHVGERVGERVSVSTAPARPLASTSTVSFVERQPSTLRQSKVSLDRARERLLQHGGLGRGVGREHREHRRHRGREHRRALGHAADGRGAGASRSLPCARCRWSSSPAAASPPPSARERRRTASGCRPRARAIGIGMPMSPVEHTSTSAVAMPRPSRGELAHAAARRVARAPRSPRSRSRS